MIAGKLDWDTLRSGLEELFLASFDRPIAPGYLDWRYIENDREEFFFSIEKSDGSLVASYSAFPVQLKFNENFYETLMSMTTMTHPNWQGRGLFRKLAADLYSKAEGLQIAAIFGFPNANSHATFSGKLEWSDIYEIPTLVFHMNDSSSAKLVLSPEVDRDDCFILHYPDLPNDGLIRIHRSNKYLSWRYFKNPVNTYKNYVISNDGIVSSYVVTKHYGAGVDLVDIQASSSEEAMILLQHIARESLDHGARHLSCWAPTHHFIHSVLEKIGFENEAPVTYFGGRELMPSAMPSDWLSYKNWYIQMGDSDVY